MNLFDLACSIRFGHATNSSSSHSILLLADGARVPSGYGGADHGSWGWDWFAITERSDRLDYVWTNLAQQVEHMIRPRTYLPTYTTEGWIDVPIPDQDEFRWRTAAAVASRVLEHEPAFDERPSIDHESTWSFPLHPKSKLPHVEFARWFRDEVAQPGVVILGGNDNDPAPPARPEGIDLVPVPTDEYHEPMVAHDRGDHWLLWLRANGTKLRIPKVRGAEVRHSTVPELADVKVTDQCGFGCTYCYQGSTPKGPHASLTPYEMAEVLEDVGVLEVAIGGGEPLEWPGFTELVELLDQRGITPNVTTRRLDLMPLGLLSKLGGVGFSVDSAEVLRRGLRRIGYTDRRGVSPGDAGSLTIDHGHPWAGNKLVVHVVLGAVSMDEVIDICRVARTAYVPVLFLAYKTDGRGSEVAPHPHDDWVQRLHAAFWQAPEGNRGGYWAGPAVGIDTPLVDRWGALVTETLRVSPRLMSPGEGQFSLYIDFVTGTYARQSYGAAERYPLPEKPEREDWRPGQRWHERTAAAVLDTFRSWHQEGA